MSESQNIENWIKYYDDALKRAKQELEQGDRSRAKIVAELIRLGPKHQDNNFMDAYPYYHIAAEDGDAESCYYVGRVLEKQNDLVNAKKFYQMGADKGYEPAEVYNAECYWFGDGCEKNLELAEKYWRLAAQKGNPFAQYRLAIMFYNMRVELEETEATFFLGMSCVEQFMHWISLAYLNDYPSAKKFFQEENLMNDESFMTIFNKVKNGEFNPERYRENVLTSKYYLDYMRALNDKRNGVIGSQQGSSDHNTNTNSNSGGCYIATSVYGSYDCPEVWTLRRFRDYVLDENVFGRMFIKVYYTVSPKLVRIFGDTHIFRKFWKSFLDYFVLKLQNHGIENTPYSDKY